MTEETASFYSRVAARYAEDGPPYFAHTGRRLVELAQVQPGDVVLDLGTGRGAVLLPAARRVGPSLAIRAGKGMNSFCVIEVHWQWRDQSRALQSGECAVQRASAESHTIRFFVSKVRSADKHPNG